jgi:lipoprotein-anchoring transpeptidase ErfK/SrfK
MRGYHQNETLRGADSRGTANHSNRDHALCAMAHRLLVGTALGVLLGALPLSAHANDRQDTFALQVALDRLGFSPGVIDGSMGQLTRKAISGFQESTGIEETGHLNGAMRAALGDEDDATGIVAVSDADAAGPFLATIPHSMAEKAKLDGLHYTSIGEALAEKYHTTPKTLRALNPGADFAAGSEITVPAVRPANAASGASMGWDAMLDKLSVAKLQPRAAKVVIDKSDRHVRVYGVAGTLLAQFPATLGSEHDPLPMGQWQIGSIATLPPFNYDPDLFWDAGSKDVKAKLPPGPNGPVGVVWIDLSKEHYGIHGTAEPETIGRTASHGCIRLTNWDAAKLAQMVRRGTQVVLQE